MHCGGVAARTRSRKALTTHNHNVKQSTSTDDDDDEEQQYDIIISDDNDEEEEEEEEVSENSDSDFNAMDDDVAVSNDDSDSEGQFVREDTTNEDCCNVERNEGERRRRGRKPAKAVEIGGVKRRKAFGLDILIDENASTETKSAAQRTRSRFNSNKNKKFKLGMGTIAQPICINDDDEEEKEADDLDDVDDHTQKEASGSEADEEEASGSESDEQNSNFYKRRGHACVQNKEKLTTRKHKKQNFNVIKILKDCIYGNVKGEVPLEEAIDQQPPQPNPCMDLPAKFSFSHKELELLWAECDRALHASPDSLVSDRKREPISQPNPCTDLPAKFSFSREGPKEAEKSEQDKELELLWAECDRALHAAPDSLVSDHKRDPSALPRKKQIHDNPKDFGVFNILRDSITGEGEVHVDEVIDNELSPIMDLPLKFSFAREEPKPPEKSEEEKQLDQLWAEMDFALYAKQDNPSPASQVQNNTDPDDNQCPKEKASIATLCSQGKHHLILNEEIGLICAYCLHIGLEIKYYLPPFGENPFGKSNRRDFYNMDHVDHSTFNDFQDQITGHDDNNHCNYTGTVWNIVPGVKKTMYPHQCEAFEFLWNNLAGGIFLDKLKKQEDIHGGSGCIISHAPGTGKTRLTIVFLQTYMKLYPTCRSMIIAPSGMLLTWEEEFRTWKVDIPFHNLNNSDYSGKESEVAMNLVRNSGRNVSSRIVKLYSWKCKKSILGLSYKLFEQLTRQDCRDKELRKFLLEHPGLLVLDEGHTPRNSHSLVWKAVSEIRTKRRIILSGTPFQNNFHELYNTLCLARPRFAEWNPSGGKEVFSEKPGCRCPIKANIGKWSYLTNSYGKATDDSKKSKILNEIRSMIHPFVHVHKGTILQESLPGMRELVVILKPTQLQKELLEDIQRKRKSRSLKLDILKKRKSLSLKLDIHTKRKSLSLKLDYEESVTALHPALFDLSEGKGKYEWLRLKPEESFKTNFLMELIRLSELMNEKVLVFSQYIRPLKLVADQLKYHFSWNEGREWLQIHGKVDAKLRQASIKTFNDPRSKVRVMLASTRACYEGISLVGASRVVLLDVVWNPSVERQAICRAYRLGQKKFVYTYHLNTAGTMEEEKSSTQAEKDLLSESVIFFNSDGPQHTQKISSAELEDRILEEMVQQEKFRNMFEKVAIKKQILV